MREEEGERREFGERVEILLASDSEPLSKKAPPTEAARARFVEDARIRVAFHRDIASSRFGIAVADSEGGRTRRKHARNPKKIYDPPRRSVGAAT